MSYAFLSWLAVLFFAVVHLWANKIRHLFPKSHRQLLSIGSGIAIAYVFIDLLPKLSKNDVLLGNELRKWTYFLEGHAYIMALWGFLLFFVVDISHRTFPAKRAFSFSVAAYVLFNFLMGYSVADENNIEVKPLFLFTLAMGLHYFSIDYVLSEVHAQFYRTTEKWVLICALFLGWLLGTFFALPVTVVALMSAFIGGGIIMNVTRHELAREKAKDIPIFLVAACIYTLILSLTGA
jgi:hypothetical protein